MIDLRAFETFRLGVAFALSESPGLKPEHVLALERRSILAECVAGQVPGSLFFQVG